MLQVVMRSGRPQLIEVPAPVPQAGSVLVDTRASVISSGTERAAVRSGGSLLQRAIRNPDLVRQTLRNARERGLSNTRDLVQGAIADDLPLGYSCAGVVLDSGGVSDVVPGQPVACAGAGYANHAELVLVPANLVVPVPGGVDLSDAAFATIGAVALQGVRRARAEIGERIAVVGLGLLGHLTAQLLIATGCDVVGFEPSEHRRELAREAGVSFGGGDDFDAVIVTASSESRDLVNSAVAMVRPKGRVVPVGDVVLEIDRGPLYEREADILISTSYGPGRYDTSYEELGIDYPIAYVRWTENRNMAAFLGLIRSGGIDLARVLEARFPITQAAAAYERVASPDPPLAVGLDYPASQAPRTQQFVAVEPRGALPSRPLSISLVGAGSFVKAVHVPNLLARGDAVVKLVVARRGERATSVSKRFAGAEAATDWHAALESPADLVFIATRHDSHAEIAAAALTAGKFVFVEKPLGLTREQIDSVWIADAGRRRLAIGFNRPFAALADAMLARVRTRTGPIQLVYRVNAPLPSGHWLSDPEQGGGRLLGEACHMFDFCNQVCGRPVSVSACALPTADQATTTESASVVIGYEEGSVATVVYSGVGSPSMPKERIEVMRGGASYILEDFRELTVFETANPSKSELRRADRGHARLLDAVITSVLAAGPLEPGIEAAYCAQSVALAACEALASGQSVTVAGPPSLAGGG